MRRYGISASQMLSGPWSFPSASATRLASSMTCGARSQTASSSPSAKRFRSRRCADLSSTRRSTASGPMACEYMATPAGWHRITGSITSENAMDAVPNAMKASNVPVSMCPICPPRLSPAPRSTNKDPRCVLDVLRVEESPPCDPRPGERRVLVDPMDAQCREGAPGPVGSEAPARTVTASERTTMTAPSTTKREGGGSHSDT
jgi:hypothetical protein